MTTATHGLCHHRWGDCRTGEHTCDQAAGHLVHHHCPACDATTLAVRCGHRWHTPNLTLPTDVDHRCTEPANHPAPCTCRCGATTTRKEGRRV